MGKAYEKLLRCFSGVSRAVDFKPDIAVVLGSGLGGFASAIHVKATLDYRDIDGFPVSTVEGHRGRYVFGWVGDVPVVCMQGRVHYYEGYSMQDVVLPIRLMRLMGARALLLTNASGGIAPTLRIGDFMLITGQIASFAPSPLIGANLDALGTRFPDMSHIYDEDLQEAILQAASQEGIGIKKGVYLQVTGPQYETPEEVRMYRLLGADAVGMSTACEAIAARHMGMEICAISCVTNMAAGILDQPLSHAEVQETADRVSKQFKALVTEVIQNI